MLYPLLTALIRRHLGPSLAGPGLEEDYAMTIEIIQLTAQIQRWLNLQVARHLAAQAERLEPVKH
jgi:hypothetical protein